MRNLSLTMLSTLVLLIYPLSLSAQNSFSLSLDVNSTVGDQADTSIAVSKDEVIAIQIFGKDIENADGFGMRFEYDATQISYESFEAGNVLPNAQALIGQDTTYVEIGLASLGSQTTSNSGLVGTIRFRTLTTFSGTEIRLVRAELGRDGQIESVTLDLRVTLQLQIALTPDFDGDGRVGFSDFLAFAGQFGSRRGDGKYEARYDLDSNEAIGFSDFLIFASSFGKEVSTPGDSATIVAIPDANLRVVIEKSLGKASGAPITRDDMASLTSLEAPNANIKDLTGLELATHLTSLDFGTQKIEENFYNSNSISNLSPLSGLTNLEWLDLDGNSISDVSALSGLTSLTTLTIRNNSILDVSALSGLTNLEALFLAGNSILHVSALSELTNLTTLHLHANSILDLSPLSGLTNLTKLHLYSNSISNVSALSGLTSLKRLDLSENSISDVSALSGLTSLEWLGLHRNSISDVSALSGLTSLKRLHLYSNNISDLSPLSGLATLEWLDLSENSISDLSSLPRLTSLEWLGLHRNSISDVSVLSGLTNLTTLHLYSNSISDVSALSGLTGLKTLDLNYNSVADLAPLVANMGLGTGDMINVKNNPLSDTSINTHIPALQGRGINVLFGAPKLAVERKE